MGEASGASESVGLRLKVGQSGYCYSWLFGGRTRWRLMKVGAWMAYPRLIFGKDVFKRIAVLKERSDRTKNMRTVIMSTRTVL